MIPTFRPLSPTNFPLSGKIRSAISRFPPLFSQTFPAFRDLFPAPRALSALFFSGSVRFPGASESGRKRFPWTNRQLWSMTDR